MIIDVHAHCMLNKLDAFVKRQGSVMTPPGYFGPNDPITDTADHIATRIALMDAANVTMQVLSAPQWPYQANEAVGVEAARISNDVQAELARTYAGRLAAYVSLPLPHINASLRELERGLDQLGAIGVTMLMSALGRSVAEQEFEPIYEEMNRRGCVLFFHPCVNGLCSHLINDYKLAASVGTSIEDTMMVMQLIVRTIPARYPRIKIIIPHLGGLIPMLMNRMDNQVPMVHPGLPERPSLTARRFWYDTVGHGSTTALRAACEAFGTDHIVAGSDYPALTPFEAYPKTFSWLHEAGLPAADLDKILHRNAPGLFGIKS